MNAAHRETQLAHIADCIELCDREFSEKEKADAAAVLAVKPEAPQAEMILRVAA